MDAEIEKMYRRILGFANGNPNVVVDAGNALVKAATDQPLLSGRNPLTFTYFPHALVETDEANYKRLCHYHKDRTANHLIKWNGRFFVVGEEAYSLNPAFDPTRGRAKYSKDYYGILFLRILLDLFSAGMPPVVNAFVAHPPDDRDHAKTLMKAVAGKWNFESNGKRYEVFVDYVNAFDEIVGGVFNATIGPDGKLIDDVGQLIGDGPTLVFDMGGGSLDLARLNKDGSVDYNKKMQSTRIGVNTAINTFKGLFDSRYPALVADAEDGLPRDMVIDIFLDQNHEFRTAGETFDCSDIYDAAINPVIRDARAAVNGFARGLVGYNRVLLDGGGAGLVYDKICETIFSRFAANGVVHTADHKRELFKANSKGGLKMLIGMKQESAKRAEQFRKDSRKG